MTISSASPSTKRYVVVTRIRGRKPYYQVFDAHTKTVYNDHDIRAYADAVADRLNEQYEKLNVNPDHIYNKIKECLPANNSFEEVQEACECSKQRGICIQTYGDPAVIAKMLRLMDWI